MDILILAGVLALATLVVLAFNEMRGRRRDTAVQSLLATFGAAQVDAQTDARRLLAWQPLAESARKLFPDAFGALDVATGRRFPFDRDAIERAHARWTADWLAWEKSHDEEYRLKGATAEHEIRSATGEAVALAKARLDRVQHEKIERYQQRYEEYIRTARALQAILPPG